MTLAVKCHVRLSELLAKVWDLKRVLELKHRTEVAWRAAQKSLDEPGEFRVTVPGFGYYIVFDKDGKIVEDPLADPEVFPDSESIPIRQQLLCRLRRVTSRERGQFLPREYPVMAGSLKSVAAAR